MSELPCPPNRSRDIGVVIPAHNAAPYLAACVESIMASDIRPERVLIVNDSSTDGTAGVIRALEQRWACVEGHCVAFGNANQTRNFGMDRLSTPVICFHDADDLSRPERLRRMSEILDAEPAVDIVTTDAAVLHNNRITEQSWNEQHGIASCPYPGLSEFVKQNYAQGGGMMVRRAVLQRVRWNERFHGADDYYFFLHALLAGFRIHVIQEPLYTYRIGDGACRRTLSQNRWNEGISEIRIMTPLLLGYRGVGARNRFILGMRIAASAVKAVLGLIGVNRPLSFLKRIRNRL